jgi:glycine C-acetyltransferase
MIVKDFCFLKKIFKGIFEILLSEKDAVISDALNHASIIDGIRLCKAQRLRYNHLDMDDLE